QAAGTADIRPPEGATVGTDVLTALVAFRAERADRAVEAVIAVLVQLAGKRVRTEDLDVDADAPVAGLHPVAVERLATVVLVRDGVVVVEPAVDVVRCHGFPTALRVAERVSLGLLGDQERLILEVEQDDRRA